MTRGVPDTNRSVSRENRTFTRNVPSTYRQQSTSIRHDPQAGNVHTIDATAAGIPAFDVLTAGMLEWWNTYIAGPWDRRKTEDESEDALTIIEGFQRIILGEKFAVEEIIGGVTYEEGSTVPKPLPETFVDDTLNAVNTNPRTWEDLIRDILAILPEEFWIGLDYFKNAVHSLIDGLSNAIATAAERIERGDDWADSAQRLFFGEKTTTAISYGEDDTAGSFPKDTLLGWVLTEPERSNLTSDNTVARDFFEFLTSIGLEPLGNFLKETWETLNEWWTALGEGIADAIKLVGEWWEGLSDAIRDGIKTAAEWVADAAGKIEEILEGLTEGFWEGIDNLGKAIETALNDAYTYLSQIGEAAWEWLAGLGTSVIKGITDAIAWVNDAVGEIQKAINKWWDGLLGDADDLGEYVDETVTTWWDTILGNATSLGNYISTSITTWWNGLELETKIRNAADWVGNAINNVVNTVSSNLDTASGVLRTKLDGIYRTASQVATAVANGISSWWGGVLGNAANLGAYILNEITTWWAGLDFSALLAWWDNIPFHRGGTDYVNGLQRVLYGEIFDQGRNRGQVVGPGNVVDAVGLEDSPNRNTRPRTFAEWLTGNIDGLITTASGVVTGVASGIQAFFTDIAQVIFGGSIIPAAYATSTQDTPETFVDDRNKHWFADLWQKLNPGSTVLTEIRNSIEDFISGIVSTITGGGSGDIMGANVNLSNLGNAVEINKPLNFAPTDGSGTPLNTAGTDGKAVIGYAPRRVGVRNVYYDLWLKTTGGGKMFFNPGTGSNRSTEFSFGKIKINTKTSNHSIGEFSRFADTLKAGVRRGGVTKVVDLFDIGTGGTPEPEPEPTIILNIDSISDRSLKVGERLSSINADASNYNGIRVLRWSKDNVWPDWASINSRTGQILFVNPAVVGSIGRHFLRVKVEETNVPSSETALSDTESFFITVNAADVVTPKPDIVDINNLTSRVGDPAETHQARLSNSATAGAVRWSKTTASPSWFRISVNGLISLHPDSTVTPNFYNGTIIATNSAGSDSHTISVRVTKHVSIASGTPVSLKQGESRSQTIRGDDGNNDDNDINPSYSLSVSGPTQSASTNWITHSGARININPPDNAILGDYAVSFKYTAAGGSESATTTFTVTVNAKDRVIVYPDATKVYTTALGSLTGDLLRGVFGSRTGSMGAVGNGGRVFLAIAGYNHWHLFQLSFGYSTSYNLGGISNTRQIRRIAIQNYTKSAVGGGDGRLVIETDLINDGANFGVRLGDAIILTSTSTRVADSEITTDSNGGSFSIKVGALPPADVTGQALDEMFGRDDGAMGYNQSDLVIYLKYASSWYTLGLPAGGLRALS